MDYSIDNEADYASSFDNIVHTYLGERAAWRLSILPMVIILELAPYYMQSACESFI